MHAGFRRAELRREATRIGEYLDGLHKGTAGAKKRKRSQKDDDAPTASVPRLDQYLCRCLVFGTRLGEEADAAPAGSGGDRDSDGARLATRLVEALQSTAGLEQACRLGLASASAVKKQLDKSVSTTGRLKWRRIFRTLKLPTAMAAADGARLDGTLPVKLEVASGTGDWVVAQALADIGTASWAAIELRHDRVYHTLSRMALQRVPNLTVMGGDAARIVREHLQRASVSHIFINFPEPPSGYLGLESASNELHLLTPAFFTDLHATLAPGGRLTLLSDNGRYCRALCATLGALRGGGGGGGLLFACEDHTASFETVSGVRLYHGVPGAECGHISAETSYFDRLWEHRQGEETERFFLSMTKGKAGE